jgi:hypothetical protein
MELTGIPLPSLQTPASYRSEPEGGDGLSFRMDSANMIFTADVMNGGGYIVPTGAAEQSSTSLTATRWLPTAPASSIISTNILFPIYSGGSRA